MQYYYLVFFSVSPFELEDFSDQGATLSFLEDTVKLQVVFEDWAPSDTETAEISRKVEKAWLSYVPPGIP